MRAGFGAGGGLGCGDDNSEMREEAGGVLGDFAPMGADVKEFEWVFGGAGVDEFRVKLVFGDWNLTRVRVGRTGRVCHV